MAGLPDLSTDTTPPYPGTPQHQAILRAIVNHYENDQRILAVAVLGSLGRSNWDQFSGIDLDVVIADQVSLDVIEELTRLCLTFKQMGKHNAIIIPDGTDAGDIELSLGHACATRPLQTSL